MNPKLMALMITVDPPNLGYDATPSKNTLCRPDFPKDALESRGQGILFVVYHTDSRPWGLNNAESSLVVHGRIWSTPYRTDRRSLNGQSSSRWINLGETQWVDRLTSDFGRTSSSSIPRHDIELNMERACCVVKIGRRLGIKVLLTMRLLNVAPTWKRRPNCSSSKTTNNAEPSTPLPRR
ncbi:hypothetical protein PM082_002306 [Marasmius tenuissimus]|nr:hypothetical protein PM082_002306 [Marasmius tenuissimus]